ncbi:TatD family hydrolase [Noviherbaspirillum sp. CPCC 100848]|uniref:TatD family hydrolase n=1 Tax=Noviherbaspirillum album TaxID=3080276 RepID=A0ABU6JG29_9BURK|nr:TatD family hydrolase [Noviherbaspirillum sp. CPCC 100848]MEC4722373.1 TatD family hydrolase [Noviherbaspirillum sp. CPCC 100848]
MWIDTHCHLDAAEFAGDAAGVASRAGAQDVSMIVIPAIAVDNFETVRRLAADNANCSYALGIHPIFVPQAEEGDLLKLRNAVEAAMDDPRLVAIGEIGLDLFIPALTRSPLREKQEHFYSEQLKIARDFDLPVLLHVRRSQDLVLKYLRRIAVQGGIAHAFNGSFQQAEEFIRRGFKLGFGGAMTFTRALQIRRLAADLPEDALVLETDAPDISPAWLHPARNSPEQLPAIGHVLAELRGVDERHIAGVTARNAHAALPRLSAIH